MLALIKRVVRWVYPKATYVSAKIFVENKNLDPTYRLSAPRNGLLNGAAGLSAMESSSRLNFVIK